MRTMTNDEANKQCECSGCDMTGQILVGGYYDPVLCVEDTIEECVATINRISQEDPITADNIDDGDNQRGFDSKTLYAWKIV